MSPDPLRLFEDRGASDELREDLRHARHEAGPSYDVDAGLARFAAIVAAGPTSGVVSSSVDTDPPLADPSAATATAPAASTAAAAGAAAAGAAANVTGAAWGAKAVAGVVLVGLLGAGVLRARSLGERDAPSPPAPASASALEPSASPRAAEAAPQVAAETTTTATAIGGSAVPSATSAPAAPRPAAAPVAGTSRSIDEETAHLGALRKAAQSDHQAAVRMADEGHARFPKGVFWQEREVLAITSLVASGRHREARGRADVFLSRHPDSPSAERLRRALGDGARE